MLLKSLELEGFKSFVDSTALNFNNGFTAIVGPNGCGKSNVSDAIRWVIGEQSSKSLRGTRITDLIFNGSGSRKPVNRAEISLTLTKVPAGIRIANVPNISEEVKITRCYHRSGESEFYINQVPCRLKDITDFLLDIGISPKVLTVIEQGHIQDIITSKPEERRILIEEAAGILKFKHRRNEAIRKLESSGQNLERITDIVQELGRRVESLKRQAAKAERYKKYQAEIKELSLKLFSRKHRHYQSELKDIEARFTEENERKTQKAARASTLENGVTELNIEIDELSTALSEKKERSHELAGQISKLEHTIELKQSQIAQAETDIEAASEEVRRMNEETAGFAAEVERQRTELTQVSGEINEQEDILKARSADLEQKKTELTEKEQRVRTEEERMRALYQTIAAKNNELTALETRRQHLQSLEEKLLKELTETGSLAEASRVSYTQAEEEQNERQRELAQLKEKKEVCQQETRQFGDKLKNKSDALSALKEDYLTQASLLASLKELREKFAGFDEGIQSLMTENGTRPSGIREVLVDVLKAPKELEPALEAVLGEQLQSIIVDSYSDTIAAIDYLKNRQSGRGSFIPLQSKSTTAEPVHLNGNPSVRGRILDFIECREEYRPVLELLLGNVVLVRDFDTALAMHQSPDFHATCVTENGETIDPRGLVSGGAVNASSAGLLSRNREIETRSQSVEDLKARLDEEQRELEDMQASLGGLKERLQHIESSVHESEISQTQSQKDIEQLIKEIERLEARLYQLQTEKSTGSEEMQALTRQNETLRQELEAAETEKNQCEAQATALKEELETQRRDLEEQSGAISGIQVRIASLIGKRENTLTEIKRLDLQQENLRHRIQKREQDQAQNKQKIEETRVAIEALEKEILTTVRDKDALQETVVREEEALTEKEEQLSGMEQEAKQLARELQELTESLSKIELKRSETRIQMAHLEEKAYDDFNATLDEMQAAFDDTVDEAASDERVRELKGKVAKIGEVNLAALSDFEETNERYLFLSKQQEDLSESIVTLHATIEKINRTTRERFIETFAKVNENFKAIFARLFQGGKAELSLSEPDNPLESGIEITANPVGKTMQNLTLLSGGEKSMTAIALMFAVFKVRPSPFCLLDEVDAPLDDANVIRFQEMLKEMAVNTQFILITHNQQTMSFADVLYGITMEEQGVSKAVSVRIN